MKRYSRVLILVLTAMSMASVSFAQSRHQAAYNLGLGGGGTAYLNSYHANFVNPANLMLQERNEAPITIGILGGLSTSAGGSLANISVYNKYFTKGLTLSNDIAAEALDQWFGTNPSNMRNMGIKLDVIPIGFSNRGQKWSTSFAIRSRVLTDIGVSRGLAELALYGLDSDVFASPRPVNFTVSSLAFTEVSLGYAMQVFSIPNFLGIFHNVKLFAGAAPKLLLGSQYSEMNFNSTLQIVKGSDNYIKELRNDFNYSFETTGSIAGQLDEYYQDKQSSSNTPNLSDYVDPSASDFYDIQGKGFGLDAGVTVQMELNIPIIGAFFKGPERLRAGLSITDLGSLKFDKQVGRFTADNELVWDGFKIDKQEIDNKYNGDTGKYYNHVLADSIGSEIYGSFVPAGVKSVTSTLPSMINFGGQLTMNKLSLSVDLGKAFEDKGVVSKRVSMATGLEYRLFGFIPLRVGMRTGGYSSTSYSAGVGLEFRNFELTFAASTVPNSNNYGSSLGAAWSGFVLRF